MNLIKKILGNLNIKQNKKKIQELSVDEATDILSLLKDKKFTGIHGFRGAGGMQQDDFPKSVDQIASNFKMSIEDQEYFLLGQLGGEEKVTKKYGIKNPEVYSTVFYDRSEHPDKIVHEMEALLTIRNKRNPEKELLFKYLRYGFVTDK